jgi:hypothetical protein
VCEKKPVLRVAGMKQYRLENSPLTGTRCGRSARCAVLEPSKRAGSFLGISLQRYTCFLSGFDISGTCLFMAFMEKFAA